MLDCLQDVDASKLTAHLLPVVDGKWLTDSPHKLVENAQFKKCPILAGVDKNEGAYFMMYYLLDYMNLNDYEMDQEQLADSVKIVFGRGKKKVGFGILSLL